MFNNKTDNETDFCESYKSQILDLDSSEDESIFNSILKFITVLVSLAAIITAAIYGYNYYLNNEKKVDDIIPPISVQIADEELKIIDEPMESTLMVEKLSEKVNEPVIQKTQESDIDKIANNIKLAIAKSEEEEKNSKQIEIEKEEVPEEPISAPEAQYLEELAELSKEIDKERK